MANELTKQETKSDIVLSDIFSHYDKLMPMCEKIAKAEDMIPPSYRGKPEKVFVAIATGMELGLKPLQSLRSIYVVNGIASLWGDNMLGLVMRSGELEYIKESFEKDKEDGITAICEVKRKGKDAVIRKYSEKDAAGNPNARKGLDTWKYNRNRMKQVRARSWALRDVFPDITGGLYAQEEVEDYTIETGVVSVQTATLTQQQESLSEIDLQINQLFTDLSLPSGQQKVLRQRHTKKEDLLNILQSEKIRRSDPEPEPKPEPKKPVKKTVKKPELVPVEPPEPVKQNGSITTDIIEMDNRLACLDTNHNRMLKEWLKEFIGVDELSKVPEGNRASVHSYLKTRLAAIEQTNKQIDGSEDLFTGKEYEEVE